MIEQLSVKDYVLFESCIIDFTNGMSVITGETGAGKSLLIDAIGYLSGDRIKSNVIRNGKDKAILSMVLTSNEKVNSILEENGFEIIEARITYLAYAPEIAAVMLQRQQASAIIDARKMIVDGAVGMVEMALDRLNENGVVELDEERKAAMVSNLLVVLCGNHDAQPVVNSGSLY